MMAELIFWSALPVAIALLYARASAARSRRKLDAVRRLKESR